MSAEVVRDWTIYTATSWSEVFASQIERNKIFDEAGTATLAIAI
jgi:hypothetical protein